MRLKIYDSDERIIENLKDAGCDNKQIQELLELYKQGQKEKVHKILEKHRKKVLDKVHKNEKVNHRKVTFHNRYGITLVADLYEPKNSEGKLPAIAVSGPFGAVKEQASGLYAQEMAERGFLTIAFDPLFTGESGGIPRYMASPDINTEDFKQQLISYQYKKMLIQKKSELLEFVDGED